MTEFEVGLGEIRRKTGSEGEDNNSGKRIEEEDGGELG